MGIETRAGRYTTFSGNRCFAPAPLPLDPPITIDDQTAVALSAADRALARLDGATLTLPDPDLFVYAFMRQEAVLSSQIEGTQASLEDLFEYEAAAQIVDHHTDVVEVINYVEAMNWALEQLKHRPISNNLIKQIHSILLREGRGSGRAPGEFRRNQNWIGPAGCSIEEAVFVPPAVPLMEQAMADLEIFINKPSSSLPPLIRCALIHAQFETIHPFWDGNGRLGRMLVTLLLCSEGVLSQPVLYLSLFFKKHRSEYYSVLQAIRDKGDVENWVLFFLRGVSATSKSALGAAKKIVDLKESLSGDLPNVSSSAKAQVLLNALFKQPYVTANRAAEIIDSTYPTANTLLGSLEKAGYVSEITGSARGRIFAFKPYLDILHESIDDLTGVVQGEDYLVTQAN